ncbi:MAG: diguanylate cyclase [Chloroflexota bacterium]
MSERNDNVLEHYDHEINIILKSYKIIAQTYYEETVKNNEDIIELLTAANYTNDSEKIILREELYDLTKETYQNAKEKNFRHLSFALKDCTNFLRVHQPDIFGDNLEGVRDTVCNTKDTQAFTEGFEEGRTFNDYRYVFPLFKDDEYIGSVEMSISLAAIMEILPESYHGSGVFIILKSITNTKVTGDLIDVNYLDSDISTKYFYDREIYEHFFDGDKQIKSDVLLGVNSMIKKDIENDLDKGEDFVINIEFENLPYSVSFINIDNFKEEHAGYLVFYATDHVIPGLKRELLINSSLIWSLWLAIISICTLVYYGGNKLHNLSIDSLTGLLNRRGFFMNAQVLYEYSQRPNGFWICFMDMDKLKAINDEYGHKEGDEAIIAVAEVLKNSFRKSDVIGRIGGDEFAVCGISASKSSSIILARLNKHLEGYNENKIKPYTLSLSIGFLEGEEMKDMTLEHMLAEADRRMYINKANN